MRNRIFYVNISLLFVIFMLICSCSPSSIQSAQTSASVDNRNGITVTHPATPSTHAAAVSTSALISPSIQPDIDLSLPSVDVNNDIVYDGIKCFYYVNNYCTVYVYNKEDQTDIVFYEFSNDSYIYQMFLLDHDLYLCVGNDTDYIYSLYKINISTRTLTLISDDIMTVEYASTNNIIYSNDRGEYGIYNIDNNKVDIIFDTGDDDQFPILWIDEKKELLYHTWMDESNSYLASYGFNSKEHNIIVNADLMYMITEDQKHIIVYTICESYLVIKELNSLQSEGIVIDCNKLDGNFWIEYAYVKDDELFLLVAGSENKSTIYKYSIKNNCLVEYIELDNICEYGISAQTIYNGLWILYYMDNNQKPSFYIFNGVDGKEVKIEEREIELSVESGFDIYDGFIWFYYEVDQAMRLCNYYGKMSLSKYIK